MGEGWAGTGKVESSGLGDPPHPEGGKEGTDLGRGRGPRSPALLGKGQ